MQERFQNFTVMITKINRSIKRIKTEEMEEFNLKSPHVSCLYYLYKENSLTAKELSDICSEDKAAISRSLEFLEENGYILCDSQLKKRYKSELKLTQKGENIAKKIAKKIDTLVDIASVEITEEKRKILYECLDIINTNLEKYCKKYEEEN